jgi:hypothetical protein
MKLEQITLEQMALGQTSFEQNIKQRMSLNEMTARTLVIKTMS